MALDLPLLQLIFNVIALTGLASLALICTILKHDNRKLTGELTGYRAQGGPDNAIRATQPDPLPSTAESEMAQYSAPLAADLEIRQYVSHRMQDWIGIQEAAKKA